ncbi:MAG: CDP-alcohol phosphatidyltransferase family protein [Aeropyrum sp.]|nr:CDP-alcohol phosphatidyltransferase family protein [Aeropyrum sp.]MCE4616759.1 CDP-alcohol phosphatidyltransferase family protein [Aeropyrum sp.]
MGLVNKLRGIYEERMAPTIARLLTNLSPNPNVYTVGGFLLAVAALVSAIAGLPALAIVLVAFSMAMDAVDGVIARHTGRSTPRGAFLDSSLDRLSDVAYHVIILILGVNPLIVLLMLGGSMAVPYLRAKGESLGLKLSGVGLMERADRSIALILIMMVSLTIPQYMNALSAAVAALIWLTVIERFARIYRFLG